MKTGGSITVFFSLIMAIVISLISALLLSAKVSAGRVQIANGVDMALFSAMAKYDRQLFEEYHLLYIDGGYGTGTLQLGKALDEIETDLMYALTPNKEIEWQGGKNFLQLQELGGSISGYTLATDCEGSVFWEQAVSYMEDTLALQGISLLSGKLTEAQNTIAGQNDVHDTVEKKGTVQDYENVLAEAEQNRIEEEKRVNENGNTANRLSPQEQQDAVQAKDVLDSISTIQKSSLLQLVMPEGKTISGWAASRSDLYRDRQLASGMGYLELVRQDNGIGSSVTDDLLFQEYILQNINHFTNQEHATGPVYGVEWILFGKLSDADNLESMINRLMLIREATNVAYLYSDSNRLAEIQVLAASLAAVLGLPAAEVVLEGAIALAWAFAESIVDVHTLLSGGKTPLVKNGGNWQVDFSEILMAIQSPESFQSNGGGVSYEDYLRVFLSSQSKEKNIAGCLEVIEESMRELPGKEAFSMNCAVDTLEVEFHIEAERYVEFTITEKRSYRTM